MCLRCCLAIHLSIKVISVIGYIDTFLVLISAECSTSEEDVIGYVKLKNALKSNSHLTEIILLKERYMVEQKVKK